MWRRLAEPSRWAILVALAATTLLYTYGLDRGPAYIGGDEAHFVSHAHAIARTGHDLNGTRLPLFVKITDLLVPNNSSRIWYQPFLFYLLAADFLVFPVSEWSARLPTTLIAVLDVWLVYLIGRTLFGDRRYALLAAALMALTPAHYIMSRQALDYICPLPFVLGWLLCVLTYFDTGRTAPLVAGGLLLGIGAYTYISSWMVMPFLAALTLLLARPPWRAAAAMLSAFAAPLLMLVWWVWREPQMLVDTLSRYRLPADAGPGAGRGTGFNLSERLTVLWDYFNPSFLFFAGGSNPTMATRQAGVFLLPIAIFLLIGIYALIKERSRAGLVLLVVFVAAPVPIALTMPDAPSYSIARAFTLVPFGILIAAAGCVHVFRRGTQPMQLAAAALLLAVPFQFQLFLGDYFTGYQARSAPRIDPVATRDVMPQIIELDRASHAPQILFSDDLDDKSVRWRFYSLKLQREDLWERARYFNADQLDPATLPPNSLLVLYATDPRIGRLIATGQCIAVAEVKSISGDPAATILRRVG
jgi:4-amino-4-deoxy-L-arabinose transferase-like glycosyltransferase